MVARVPISAVLYCPTAPGCDDNTGTSLWHSSDKYVCVTQYCSVHGAYNWEHNWGLLVFGCVGQMHSPYIAKADFLSLSVKHVEGIRAV